jgi:lactam utilization protein B
LGGSSACLPPIQALESLREDNIKTIMAKKIETTEEEVIVTPVAVTFTEEEATAYRLGLKTIEEIINDRKQK